MRGVRDGRRNDASDDARRIGEPMAQNLIRSETQEPPRKLVFALLAATAIVVSMTLGVPFAQAHDDGTVYHMEHHCSSGEVCLFEAINYDHGYSGWTGNVSSYYWLNYQLTDDGHSHRVNDTASSIDNDGQSCGSRHFVDVNHSGANFWLAKGNAIADLGGWSNTLSSHRWCS